MNNDRCTWCRQHDTDLEPIVEDDGFGGPGHFLGFGCRDLEDCHARMLANLTPTS